MTDLRLVLPYRCPRARLAAFGVVMGLWGAIVAAIVAPLAPVPRVAVAVLIGVLVAVGFRARPREAVAVYRLWVRASRLYAKVARHALLVLFHAVMCVTGLAGTSLLLARPPAGRSLWQPREALSTAAYGSQFDAPAPGWAGRPWRAIAGWAIGARHVWAISVVPFLFLVSLLDTDDPGRYPDGIYTLF